MSATFTAHPAGNVIAVRAAMSAVLHIAVSDRSYREALLPHWFGETLCKRSISAEWTECLSPVGPSGVAIPPQSAWRAPGTDLRPCARCAKAWTDRITTAHTAADAEEIYRRESPRYIDSLIDAIEEIDSAEEIRRAAPSPFARGWSVDELQWRAEQTPSVRAASGLEILTGPGSLVTHLRVAADPGPDSARTVCGKVIGAGWRAVSSVGSTGCRACHNGQTWEQTEAALLDVVEEDDGPTLFRQSVLDYTSGGRHGVAAVFGTDSDTSRDSRTGEVLPPYPTEDDFRHAGWQGSARTACGAIGYGVLYYEGPAVDCQACQDAEARRQAYLVTLDCDSRERVQPTGQVIPPGWHSPDEFLSVDGAGSDVVVSSIPVPDSLAVHGVQAVYLPRVIDGGTWQGSTGTPTLCHALIFALQSSGEWEAWTVVLDDSAWTRAVAVRPRVEIGEYVTAVEDVDPIEYAAEYGTTVPDGPDPDGTHTYPYFVDGIDVRRASSDPASRTVVAGLSVLNDGRMIVTSTDGRSVITRNRPSLIMSAVADLDRPRRAPSSVGNPVDVEKVARALSEAVDGATVDGRGKAYAGDGILVAIPEHGRRVKIRAGHGATDMRNSIRRWVQTVAPVVSSHAAHWFGAWSENGVIYLDVVQSFSSADEAEALAAGRARGERAVWHNGRKECIYLDR